MSAQWKMFTRCKNVPTTTKATFIAESSSSHHQTIWRVRAESAFLELIRWYLEIFLMCLYFLIKGFSDSDSANTTFAELKFFFFLLWSQSRWPGGGLCQRIKMSNPSALTFCSWLISFCLVWRATKACSCSICSCCFSSTASCICWAENGKKGKGAARLTDISLKHKNNRKKNPSAVFLCW